MVKTKTLKFMGTIYKIWMMRHVDVPDAIVRELQKQKSDQARGRVASKSTPKNRPSVQMKYIPVVAIVNHKSARTTLVPAGGGRFRMQINAELRKAAGVDTGDVATVEVRLDRSSRELPMPADLRAGLKGHPKAAKSFEELPPGHKRQLIQWFDSPKSAESRKRRLDRAIDHLLERALLPSGHGKSKED